MRAHGLAGVTADMTLEGTYVPSKQQWVRDQVAEYEASPTAQRANTLRDTGDPIVVITSVGAKSGNLRKNPVMRVERDGTYVAIASKGGAPTTTRSGTTTSSPTPRSSSRTARRSTPTRRGSSRATSAPSGGSYAVATWPTYGEYQKKTDREIPVFLLERDGLSALSVGARDRRGQPDQVARAGRARSRGTPGRRGGRWRPPARARAGRSRRRSSPIVCRVEARARLEVDRRSARPRWPCSISESVRR